jgi:pyrroloquinoline quinone biosynthesis protein B
LIRLKIRVLGSAAGGGFPQWNCNCRNCARLRAGTLNGTARTQSSIAVNSGSDWVLVNASPDIAAQLAANPELQPNRRVRDTAIRAIVLVDGQIDHTTGLFMLREANSPWPVWCSDRTHTDLTQGNPVLSVLKHYCGVTRHPIDLDGEEFAIPQLPGVRWQALPVTGKPAPYSPNRETAAAGDNLALVITEAATGHQVVYAPALADINESLWVAMNKASCVMVDGTFWDDEEMPRLNISKKRARDLGHLPQSGPGGTLEWLERLPNTTRKILIHINNTNPILDEDSAQSADLLRRGVEKAWDGMEIQL